MDNSSWYVKACGPRGDGALELPLEVWKRKYSAGWFEVRHLQNFTTSTVSSDARVHPPSSTTPG